MGTRPKCAGFSITELMMALAIAMMFLALGLPAMTNTLRSARMNGATRQLVSDIRESRARATLSGWEFRLVSYAAGSTQFPNRYRVLGRSSGSVAWPAVNSAPFRSATQSADAWIDVSGDYQGVTLAPRNGVSQPECMVTFNSQGAATMSNSCFDPFEVVGHGGNSRSLRISSTGGVRTQ